MLLAIKQLVFSASAALLLAGCVHYWVPEEDPNANEKAAAAARKTDEPVLEYYELVREEKRVLVSPLPTEYPYTLSAHFSDGHDESRVAYRGWDFDKNSRIDMLEVLDANGETKTYAFDFNGDGKVDFVKHKRSAIPPK